MTEIKYVRGAIDAVAGTISQAARDIDTELGDLNAEFSGFFNAGLQGEAGEALRAAQSKWDTGIQQIKDALTNLGPKLSNAGDGMFDADRRIASDVG